MTTLYRPVLIESAEQAEALPEGTAVVRLDIPWIATRRGPDENGHTWWESKNGYYEHPEMFGDTALVPIETEEEWAVSYSNEPPAWSPSTMAHALAAKERGDLAHRRYKTLWEEA